MTTKLEKEFFIKFNVGPYEIQDLDNAVKYCQFCLFEKPQCDKKCKEYNKIYKKKYPEINSDVVLKLMKILLQWRGSLEVRPYFKTYSIATGTELYSKAGDSITDATLQNCIKHYDDMNIQKDIKKLFKKKGIL